MIKNPILELTIRTKTASVSGRSGNIRRDYEKSFENFTRSLAHLSRSEGVRNIAKAGKVLLYAKMHSDSYAPSHVPQAIFDGLNSPFTILAPLEGAYLIEADNY